jgi:hypothetical protein
MFGLLKGKFALYENELPDPPFKPSEVIELLADVDVKKMMAIPTDP